MQRTFTSFLTLAIVMGFVFAPFMQVEAARAPTKFLDGPSADDLREQYDEEKDPIRILIAPGHEPFFGGAEYQGIYEREIVIDIAAELKRLLGDERKYEIVTTRSNTAWNKTLDTYFDREDDEIEDFVKDYKKLAAKLERRGDFTPPNAEDQVSHNTAPTDVALRLYGINRWANENDIDLLINLHINDAPDHGPNDPSQHTGYAIYIPDRQYGNHDASEELAESLEKRLKKLSSVSTHPGEDEGIIESQELIAIGAYGTLAVPSVLIEYGYITEPRFAINEFRQTVTKDLAYQTYLAVQDFFDDPVKDPRPVTRLPLEWPEPTVLSTGGIATSSPVPALPTTMVTPAPGIPSTPLISSLPAPIPVSPMIPGAASSTPAGLSLCAPFTTTFRLDIGTAAKSDEVARLQRILAKDKAVYPEGLITGIFGPATERAVKKFQETSGIISSGTATTTGYGAFGPKTAAALLMTCVAS